MKTLTAQSIAIASCTLLLLGGTVSYSFADGIDDLPAQNEGNSGITVAGDSNNAARRDLILGSNNVSGSGNNSGEITDQPHEENCMYIQNGTDVNLTNGTASVDLDGTVTTAPPEELDAGETATACARSNYWLDSLLTLRVNYEIIGNNPAAFQFSMTNVNPSLPTYTIVQPGPPSPYSAGLITRTTDGVNSASTSFLIDCPGPLGCDVTSSPLQQAG